MNSEHQASFKFFIASVAVHLFLIILFSLWSPKLPIQEWKGVGVKPDTSRLEIKTFSQEELDRLRTVGKREGQRDGFSAPVPQGSENRFPDEDEPISFEPNRGEQLPAFDFSNLTPSLKAEPQKLPAPEKASLPEIDRGIQLRQRDLSQPDDPAVRLARQQEQIQSSVLREIGVSPQAQEALKRTGFNVQFEPPEGIDEDELNSIEKIFYSFQRRTFYNFVTNFLSSYQRILFSKPHVKRVLESESHHMIGRVEFDQDGHVTSIRIFKASDHSDVTSMFEETLKNMNLPNPPLDLLNTDQKLIIHFHLRIN